MIKPNMGYVPNGQFEGFVNTGNSKNILLAKLTLIKSFWAITKIPNL